LEARYLEFELTETVLMENVEFSTSILQALKTMKVQLAVDDFGTGYSSFSYLRQFPIDVLKIDQSFVKQIAPNSKDSTIVSAIIGMGKSLGHMVLAEGVETAEQRDYLLDQHCAEGQGYLFSRPLAAAAFASLLVVGAAGLVVQ
jgi:EAL domain-containing protein (putative c-di-GMP-specific phosphodiesterase class I)